MIPEYRYRVRDNSIITPFFKNRIVAPLLRFVPWGVPANIITVVSNLFMYAALILALTEYPGRTLRFILIPLLVLAYAVGDHLDGMQAKRTQTSSALGELCDHYLDIFNNGILVYIVCLSFRITQPGLVAFFLTAGYLAHAAMFCEQFSTKYLYFEKIGSLESLLILSACMFLSAFDPVYRFLQWSAFHEYYTLTYIQTAFILSSSGAFVTTVQIIRRARIVDARFYVFCAFLIVAACLGATFLPSAGLFYVLMMYAGLYIGNLQRGHLADGKKRIPDFVVPLFVAAAFAFEPLRGPGFLWGLYIYLAVRTIWIAGNAFWILRGFWVWKNPRRNEA